MYQQLPYLNLPIGEVTKSSYMSGLDNTGAGLNLGNLEYHQSVAECHPKLMLKFAYLKDMDDVNTLNTSGLESGKKK